METSTHAATPVDLNRLVRDLTGLTSRKRDKILRMIDKLEEELDDNGLVLFGGGSSDGAILLHRDTGVVLGHVSNYGVFMGGDLPLSWTADGIEYSRDLSPTSGNFANVPALPTASTKL
jgi:hypothetical protein